MIEFEKMIKMLDFERKYDRMNSVNDNRRDQC